MRNFGVLFALALFGSGTSLEAQAPGTSGTGIIGTADFAALPAVRKPILSGDGRQIAARATIDGKQRIILMDADRPEARPKAIAMDETSIMGLEWAGSHRLLLTALIMQKLGSAKIPTLRLFSIDVPSGVTRIVDTKSRGIYAGDVLYIDPTGSWALVASQDDIFSYPSVKRVDLSTGLGTVVEKARPNVWDWYADDKGVVRAGIAYEGRRWTIWYRDDPAEKLRKVKGKIAKADDSAVDRIIFGPDHNAWIVTNEKTGRFGLYKYDFNAGAIGEAVFENDEVDLEHVIYEPFSGKLVGVDYNDDRHRTIWFDPERKALQQQLDKALPNAINTVADASADEKRYLIWSGSASDPGMYFLLDRTTRRMHPVVAPYNRIDRERLAEVKAVKYQARDGLTLPAYLTLPRGKEPKGLPLVLLPHGGPFERDDWTYDPLVQFYASRGYAVLQPQFRGSTGYGKSFVERGYGEFGKKMQDDLDDGVDWLARTGQIDPKRVCIAGMSYGGYAAMWGAIRNPERYRCAISWAGPSDLSAMLRHDRRLFSATRYYREWRSKVAGEGKSDLAAVSPIKFAASVKVPILIGHGEEDERVPVEQSHEMVKALEKANAKVSSIFYKESGHDFATAKDLEDWLKRMEAFLSANNPS
jgi:dipeptidyl aminopeptidase/acylaminoacyl peptidase